MSRSLGDRRKRLRERMRKLGPMLRGSVTTVAVRCGNPNCKCAKGEKHSSICLSSSRKGRTKMFYLGRGLAPKAREWVKNFRTLMRIVEDLSDINVALLEKERAQKRSERRKGKGSRR